jgi:hypothetical protein
MSYRVVLDAPLVPRQTLGSLLHDGVPLGIEIQVLLANFIAFAHVRNVRLVGGNPSLCARSRTVRPSVTDHRAAAENTIVGTHRSDWRQDQCQHTFWRLCWGQGIKIYQMGHRWPVQRIVSTFLPATLSSRLWRLCRLRISKSSRSTRSS